MPDVAALGCPDSIRSQRSTNGSRDKYVLKHEDALATVLTTVSRRSLAKGQQNIECHRIDPLLSRQVRRRGYGAT
jgi:hypothetical protein